MASLFLMFIFFTSQYLELYQVAFFILMLFKFAFTQEKKGGSVVAKPSF